MSQQLTEQERKTTEIMQKFNDVFQLQDVNGLADIVAEDCIIEGIAPAPNGSRHIGKDACVALWTQIATSPGTSFDLEGVDVLRDRAIIIWRYRWGTGDENSIRGVNLMRVRGELIVEALGYVKGS